MRLLLGLLFFAGAAFPALPPKPADPGATADARRILEYLALLPSRYDQRVISGQQVGRGALARKGYDDAVAPLETAAGKGIALFGGDYGFFRSDAPLPGEDDIAALNRILIRHWKQGGLVTVSFHARNPWTGGNAWDTSGGDLRELTRPGSRAHEEWIKSLDRVAAGLRKLQDAGVVVLWRPFHEMNGTWFWWCRKKDAEADPAGFVALWRHMFDYFTREKGLHNLLWVFSASSGSHLRTPVQTYYPGSDYCDITGVDHYSEAVVINGYNELVRYGKPFALTEYGPGQPPSGTFSYPRLIAKIRDQYPLTTYFLAWSTGWSMQANRDGAALLADPWVITREKLDWQIPGHRRWRQLAALRVREPKVLTEAPRQWSRVELALDLEATYDTPFDAEQIAVDALVSTPSGKTLTVPGFFWQDYERQVWGRTGRFTEEVMVESSPPGWRVRLTPTEAGRHTVRIRVRDKSGEVTSEAVMFTAARGSGKGFLRVSKKDPRYFEFDDGTPYFANGLNIVEHPLSDYYRYFTRLAAAGGNFGRLWLGFEYLGLELGRMGDYRLDNAWQLDQLMELSEQLGIYQKMCIEYMRYVNRRGQSAGGVFGRADWAYSVDNGGPATEMREFFTLPESRRLFKNRLRYLVARWGYSQNIMAWELWNEINLVDPKAADHALLVEWSDEMCRYLKSIDPWQHMTTNSLSGRDLLAGLWKLPSVDFAQRHGYWSPKPGEEAVNNDLAELVWGWLDAVDDFGKPYLMAEFGLQRDRLDIRALSDRDDAGVHMHNGMWAALAHGSAGTAHLWWWGQYVDPKNLYFHYRGVANFTEGIPWTTANFQRAEIKSPERLRALGLRGEGLSILWLHNRDHIWWNTAHNRSIEPVGNAEVNLAGYRPGRYRVEYWDTWQGRKMVTAEANVTKDVLSLQPPAVERDIAVKIFGPLKRPSR